MALFAYDMGPIYEQISQAWEIFMPYFISGTTVVVLNEYGKLQSEGLWRFCNNRVRELVPVHKPMGSCKGFLYAG